VRGSNFLSPKVHLTLRSFGPAYVRYRPKLGEGAMRTRVGSGWGAIAGGVIAMVVASVLALTINIGILRTAGDPGGPGHLGGLGGGLVSEVRPGPADGHVSVRRPRPERSPSMVISPTGAPGTFGSSDDD
jgi:hypothetical protein